MSKITNDGLTPSGPGQEAL